MADNVLDYSQPEMFARLDVPQFRPIEGLPDDPVGICAAAQALVIQPADAAALGDRCGPTRGEEHTAVNELIAALTDLDPSPLHLPRTPRPALRPQPFCEASATRTYGGVVGARTVAPLAV